MKSIHYEISLRLKKLDFNSIYPGFHPFRFAIYDDKKVCFGESEISWDSRFAGNTAIDYDGEILAIWNMKCAVSDMNILTSKLVHEMFHAYQQERKDTCYPDELDGAFYPRDFKNFKLRFLENQCLAGLAEKFYAAAWSDFETKRACRLRHNREAVDYEIKAEEIEGSARYAELGALKRLSPGLYQKELGAIVTALRSPEKIFDARLLSYDTGCLIRIILADNALGQPDWGREQAAAMDDTEAADVPGLDTEFERYFGEIDKKVKDILASGEKLDISGKELLLFDPYNVRSSGDYLYHPHIVGIGTDKKKPELLMGTYVTKMKGHTRAIEDVWRAAPGQTQSFGN